MTSGEFLDFHELNALLANLPEDDFVVAFFINNGAVSQDEWMRPLADRLRQDGIVVIGILVPENMGKCDLGTAEYLALVSNADVNKLNRINVFIISDQDSHILFPINSKVLGCCHAFDLWTSPSMPGCAHNAGMLDAYLVSWPINENTRIATTELWTGLTSHIHNLRKSQNFHIIPCAYPRLAALRAELRKSEEKPDSIIYAPSGIDWLPERGGKVQTCGKRIIRILLASFPDFNVVFRPYKNDLGHSLVREICETFAGEPRFILDESPDRLFSFSRGAALVTDFSHIGQTFAYSTFRPAVYFQPREKDSSHFHPCENGFSAGDYKGLVSAIREALKRADEIGRELSGRLSKIGLPVDSAFDEIAGWLKDFYHDRPRKEWLTIDRSNQEIMPSEIGAIRRVLKETPNAIPGLAATAFRFGNPESPLLAAVALHTGMIQFPKSHYYLNISSATYKILGMENPNSTLYGETDPEIVRKLYSMALLEMLKKGDAEGQAMVEQLLASFNAAFPEVAAAPGRNKTPRPPVETLNERGLKKLLDSLPEDKFVVALFANAICGAQYEWLDALAAHLRKKGYVAIAITTPQSAEICRFNSTRCQAIVPVDAIKSLDRINVFVISDYDSRVLYPSTSKVLACVHSFYHSASATNLPSSMHFISYVDGWMVPMRLSAETRELTRRLWTGFLNPEHCLRKSPKFHIIPIGYPRLAAMNEELKKTRTKPDSIVYAPLSMNSNMAPGGYRVRKHGLRIIQTLLDNFPEYNVIFRPMPGEEGSDPAYKEILAFYKDEPRFILDDDSAQLPSFSRAATVITDLSNIVKSFAFLTLRPGIFFRPWEENASDSPVRWDGGFHANTYAALIAAVRASIDSFPEESEIIRRNRDKLIMPIDNALAEIADWLPDFYAGKSRDEWLAIDRSPDAPLLRDYEIIDECLNPTASACAARFNDPDNPLLAAFALHQGLRYSPLCGLILGLHAVAAKLLNKPIPYASSYSDIDPDDTRKLYNMALAEKIRRDDRKGRALVEKLLREFNELCAERSSSSTGKPI